MTCSASWQCTCASLPYFYSVSALDPVQPWVMNWNAIRNSLESTGLLNVWYDESKKKA